MKPALSILAAVAVLASSSAFAAGKPKAAAKCTFEICYESSLKHGWNSVQASNFCNRELPKGTACRNVGK